MTVDDTKRILAVLKTAYPGTFRGMSYAEGNNMVNLWASMLTQESYADVNRVVGRMIATRTVGYAPNVAEIKKAMTSALPETDIWTYRREKLNAIRDRLGMPAAWR